jgi:phage tail-like protein
MAVDILNPVGSAVNNLDRKQRISDYLSNYHFHVMDMSFSTPTVFNLSAGFRFCTAPEISADIKEIKEGTFEFPRKVITGGKVSDITLHRGTSFFDSDFYDWISPALAGKPTFTGALGFKPQTSYRKNILIIQYSDISTNSNSQGFTPFQTLNDLIQFVPARAWMCFNSLPVSYKSGTDLDALGADMSIAELVISPSYIEEYSLGI